MFYCLTSLVLFVSCFSSVAGTLETFQRVRFNNVVVFGDSYSDTGNVYKLSKRLWPKSPPYYYGRYCNGPMWIDQLQVRNKRNYAYGGATTDNNFVQGKAVFGTLNVPGIQQQIDTYLKEVKSSIVGSSQTLHIIWGGGNDLLGNPPSLPPAVVPRLLSSVQVLLNNGAKHILVFNAIPAQYVPALLNRVPAPQLTVLATMFNDLLQTGMHQLQQANPQASLSIFDIHALITKVITTPSTCLTDTTHPCWNSTSPTSVVKLCSDPEKFVFLDDFHFTHRVHTLIVEPVRSFLFPCFEVNSASSYIHPA